MLDVQKAGLSGSEAKRNWLVFVDGSGIGESLVERLKGLEQRVVSVGVGDRFAKVGEGVFTVDPLRREDYAALLKELARQDCAPQKIIHMWSLTGEEEGKRSEAISGGSQARGFYSLLRLAQAIGQSMTSALEILVISNDMQSVTGVEALQPSKATVLGPCKVIPQEFVNIRCRSIDLSSDETAGWQAERLMRQLVGEISVDASEEVDSIVALRRGQRWVERFEAVRLTENGDGKALLREGGVYLITGGLGGIGLAVAEQLARVAQAKLVLLGRAGLPDRAQWDEYAASTDTENVIAEKIKKVRALEALGAEVLVFSADVSDESRMREVVAEADARFGAIHGVIHAAGVPGAGIIQLKTQEVADGVLAPKVQGALVLERVLKDRPLDFLVLFSTISSITGEVGQVDYCAANAFLDAFAHYHSAKSSTNTVSVNWGQWQWDDWEAKLMAFLPKAQARLKKSREMFGMTFAEGVEALNRVLSAGLPRVVVSPQDFEAILEQGRASTASDYLEEAEKVRLSEGGHSRPLANTAYVGPRNEVERQLAEIWQGVFGISQIGIHDSFFDLGGHSLLAIQLISRLRETFRLELPLGSLFESPTISGLAQTIEEHQREDEGADDLEEMLKEIENLSLEEVRTRLAEESQANAPEGTNG
jgi:NAD(P)-dependent dehydrogenase (short-subunit alcohol dehydrogenase family)/acyl carrier protein